MVSLLEDKNFFKIMLIQIRNILEFLLEKNQTFGVLAYIEKIEFLDTLPDDAKEQLKPLSMFYLSGYTLSSALIDNKYFSFEAGFGKENVGIIVKIPLLSIYQIIIEDIPILINSAKVKEERKNNIENSIKALLSKPENKEFFKKIT